MLICTNGMYRSGTTMIHKMICHALNKIKILGGAGSSVIIPESVNSIFSFVYHFHDWPTEDEIIGIEAYKSFFSFFYTYRDIRDTLASFCQKKQCNISNFNHSVGFNDMVNFLVDTDLKWKKLLIISNNNSIVKYEDFRYNTPFLVSNVIKFIETPRAIVKEYGNTKFPNRSLVTDFQTISYNLRDDKSTIIKELIKEFDWGNQKKQEFTYGANHINDGRIGKWKTFFTKEEIDKYFRNNQKLNDWLVDNKYTLDYED